MMGKFALKMVLAALILLFLLPSGLYYAIYVPPAKSWWSARTDPSGLSPDPARHPEAVVQVFVARAFGWRGAFGVHSWLAIKARGAAHYQRLEVIGWGVGAGRPAVRISERPPDGYWFGTRPRVILDIRGARAEELQSRILAAAARYPYRNEYRVWPGPNSNTFTAYIGRSVPELGLHLPSTAVGKDFVPLSQVVGRSISGRGVQISLYGLAGFTIGPVAGLEVNLLGLTAGIDFSPPAVSLPGFGRLGSPASAMHQ